MSNVTKKKGPIRFEAIVPIGLIIGVAVAYMVFLLDLQLRWAMETAGTYVNGAEVNVASVKTSVFDASIEIGRIQVTDPGKPTHNRFELEQIRLAFLWDGLLRAKAVSEEASVMGIVVDSKRETPGRVLPPDEGVEGNPIVKRLAEATRESLGQSDLARLPEIIRSLNPDSVLKNMGESETSKYLSTLSSDLEKQQGDWEKALTKVPGQAEADRIKAKANGLGRGGTNPAAIRKKIGTAKSIAGDAKRLAKNSQSKFGTLKNDVLGFGGRVAAIDQKIEEDQRRLEKKLNLPRIGTDDLAEKLFGASELSSFAQAQKNVELARSYIPEKSESEEKPPAIEPRVRAAGKTYQFGKPGQYPSYWIKRISISSGAGPEAAGGKVTGALTDLSSNQAMTGKPTVLDVRGDFPVQRVRNVQARVEIDHRARPSKESFRLSVGSFPIENKFLSDSKELRLKVERASLAQTLEGRFVGQSVMLKSEGAYSKARYEVEGESAWLRDNVKGVVQKLSRLTYRVVAKGTWSRLKFSFASNLAQGLSAAIQAQVAGKLNEARAKIRAKLTEQTGAKRREIEGRYASTRDSLLSRGGGRVAEVKSSVKTADSRVKQLERDLKKKAAAPAKKAVKNIRKKFGF